MKPSPSNTNAAALANDFLWLQQVIRARFDSYFRQKSLEALPPPPSLDSQDNAYAQVVKRYPMTVEERLLLLLALAPHFSASLLDIFFNLNTSYNRRHTEFGGIVRDDFSGFLPTGETAMFVLAGGDLEKRLLLMPLFQEQHFFYKHNILTFDFEQKEKPLLGSWISVSEEYLSFFSTGQISRSKYKSGFQGQKLTTPLVWEDLVLPARTNEELLEIKNWVENEETILKEWGLERNLKSGFRALFSGPSGTGKTLAAALIGKATDREVYEVAFPVLISKYIGETEKNISRLFARAEAQGWILFFDEADALFGKRTTVSDSHDRYANQEVSYLLQRIENHPGIIILATDHYKDIKEQFARRFQALVHFPMPGAKERLQIWRNVFSGKLELSDEIDLQQIAENYELAGGSIINVLRHCSLMAMRRQSALIREEDLLRAIKREIGK